MVPGPSTAMYTSLRGRTIAKILDSSVWPLAVVDDRERTREDERGRDRLATMATMYCVCGACPAVQPCLLGRTQRHQACTQVRREWSENGARMERRRAEERERERERERNRARERERETERERARARESEKERDSARERERERESERKRVREKQRTSSAGAPVDVRKYAEHHVVLALRCVAILRVAA